METTDVVDHKKIAEEEPVFFQELSNLLWKYGYGMYLRPFQVQGSVKKYLITISEVSKST